jgi:hypothetical protein
VLQLFDLAINLNIKYKKYVKYELGQITQKCKPIAYSCLKPWTRLLDTHFMLAHVSTVYRHWLWYTAGDPRGIGALTRNIELWLLVKYFCLQGTLSESYYISKKSRLDCVYRLIFSYELQRVHLQQKLCLVNFYVSRLRSLHFKEISFRPFEN